MQNSQQFAEQFIQTSRRCILFTDADNRITKVNPQCMGWLDCNDTEKPIGTKLEDLGAKPSLRALFAAAMTKPPTREAMTFQKEVPVDVDGNAGMLSFRCTLILDDNGDSLGFAYVFSVESILEESEFDRTMINNLMRNSPDLIYFKDLESRFIRISDSMLEKLEIESMEKAVGKSDFDFWGAESASEFYETEQEIIRTRQPISGKTESGVKPNGEVTWTLMSKMPLIDEKNQVVGTFGINKDITLQKQVEAELEETNQELVVASRQAGMAEIATNILHNVGNVLNSINVSISQADEITRRMKLKNLAKVATMLAENAKVENYLCEDEKGKRIPEYLGLIAEEISKEQGCVLEELESTKRHLEHIKVVVSMQQEYATANLVIEYVDLAEVVEDAIRMSSSSLERHNIKLIREFKPGLIVPLDKHRVMQILVNLVRNAKQAMKTVENNDKKLVVSVDQNEPGMVTISVKDNGIGISPENLTNLFNHGFTTKKNGHGFGLHSGANFARELGGSLIATSEGIGKGATFALSIPYDPESPDQTPSSRQSLMGLTETPYPNGNAFQTPQSDVAGH